MVQLAPAAPTAVCTSCKDTWQRCPSSVPGNTVCATKAHIECPAGHQLGAFSSRPPDYRKFDGCPDRKSHLLDLQVRLPAHVGLSRIAFVIFRSLTVECRPVAHLACTNYNCNESSCQQRRPVHLRRLWSGRRVSLRRLSLYEMLSARPGSCLGPGCVVALSCKPRQHPTQGGRQFDACPSCGISARGSKGGRGGKANKASKSKQRKR